MSALPPKADIASLTTRCLLCAKSRHMQCSKRCTWIRLTRSPRRRARGAWAKAPARRRAGKGWLSGPLYQGFNRLHHRSLWIAKAIISHLLHVLVQKFQFIDGRLTALAVIVAAQPDRDVSRFSNLAVDQLIACDL